MTTIRRSPIGYLIEEREGGLYLHECQGLLEPRRLIQSQNYTRVSERDGFWYVWIGLEENPGPDNCQEFGQAEDHDEAWRYALGAALGSYEDPIVQYDPLIT